jgi:hypothetical protein
MNIWTVMPAAFLKPLRVLVLHFCHKECTSTWKVLHTHTQKHVYDKMSVVKRVKQKEKMFPFLFHSSFNDNVWTVGCKRHDWRIMNVEFESNLHPFMLICYFPRAMRNTALYKYHNQDVQFPSQDSNCLPLKYEAWQPIKRPQHEVKEDKETAAKEWELCN